MQKRTMFKILILPDEIHVSAPEHTLVSDALSKAGITISKPCGGKGTCGRCLVFVDGVSVKGCETIIKKDCTITVPSEVRLSGQEVLTDIRLYDKNKNVAPLVTKVEVNMTEPTFDDFENDTDRFRNALCAVLGLENARLQVDLSVLKKLPKALRDDNFTLHPTIFYDGDCVHVLSLTDKPIYGLAIDIGTTTLVVTLCDLQTGETVESYGMPNPQAEYGADVISRIIYTEDNPDGLATLQLLLTQALTHAINSLVRNAKISKDEVTVAVIAANTVMSHMLLGLPTDYLRREPYVPAANNYPLMQARDLGLPMLANGKVIVMPSISSYVGGDITAGVIATEIYKREGLHLFVDVGTNGEIVLAGEGFMMTCSCSAGPAFEGSGISCGSRAISGAIDNVYFKEGKLCFDVIKNGTYKSPVSICGSGFISILSAFLDNKIINRTGKFIDKQEKFTIADDVSITEADIQNLIRSKGAIFAGIRMLISNMGFEFDDLTEVLIAGGFGRSINISNAIDIGMFPEIDENKYDYVGNSALAGALRVLNDRTIDIAEIARSITNLELSNGNEFMEEFTRACFLPHTDFTLFKNTN